MRLFPVQAIFSHDPILAVVYAAPSRMNMNIGYDFSIANLK